MGTLINAQKRVKGKRAEKKRDKKKDIQQQKDKDT